MLNITGLSRYRRTLSSEWLESSFSEGDHFLLFILLNLNLHMVGGTDLVCAVDTASVNHPPINHHPQSRRYLSTVFNFNYYLLFFGVFFFFQISGIFLTHHIKWVGCQGSRSELRGYPCSLWKLFHTLTVEASTHPDALVGTGELSLYRPEGPMGCLTR